MSYQKNQIKDHELPALLFLIETLLDQYFGKDQKHLETKDFNKLISEVDRVEYLGKPISVRTIKNIFELQYFDNGYRPRYKSVEFFLFGVFKQNRSFSKYQNEYTTEIKNYFEALNYVIHPKNPEKDYIVESKVKKIIYDGQPKLIDTRLGVVSNLLEATKLIVGDLENLVEIRKESSLVFGENKRITNRLMRKEKRRQKNTEQVISKAADFAKEKKKTNKKIYDDWIVDFFEIAQDCSDEKMQYLWAKLLAGELENPGNFSRRTLQRIKEMTQYEALIFEYISRCLWLFKDEYNGDQMVLILDDHHYADHYFDETFEFDGSDINNLENLGLLKLSYVELTKDEHYSLSFFSKEHTVGAKLSHYEFSFAALTPSGEEIVSLIDAKPNLEYYKKTLDFFKKRRILIK